MSLTGKVRAAVLALGVGAMTLVAFTPSADARYRRHYGGALALGIGSLVVAGILASQHRRHYRRAYYYDDYYYRPTYYRPAYYSYSYAAPRYYVVRHRGHHRHWRRW